MESAPDATARGIGRFRSELVPALCD